MPEIWGVKWTGDALVKQKETFSWLLLLSFDFFCAEVCMISCYSDWCALSGKHKTEFVAPASLILCECWAFCIGTTELLCWNKLIAVPKQELNILAKPSLVKLQKTIWLIIFDGKDEQKLQWFWITNVTAVCLGQRAQSQN